MDTAIQEFKRDKIPVFERGEEEYERSVATPNLLYRFARPEFVLQPETPEHVQAIIQQARAQNLLLTIKCGGHSYAGHSTAFEGVSLDLRRMNKTKLDMASKTVTFGAGCQWAHVYKTLINGRHDGFVINGGRCPFVGVSGFLLGGGLGPFSRSIGMGSDTIKEIKIVTADSELLTVKDTDSRSSKEGRLFWALCGAGGGNFGVVVEMTLAVKQLQAPGGTVVAGRYQWFGQNNEPDLFEQKDFISTMNDFYTTDWPERITIDSTWICDLRQSSGNGVRFLTYFDGDKDDKDGDKDGDKDDFDSIIHQYIKHPQLSEQLRRRSLPEKSTRFLHETLVAQWSEETVKAFPTNKSYSIYSSFVFRNDRPTIEKVTELIREKAVAFRKAFPGERVEFLATFIHSGAKMSAPKPADSAFFWREATYHMYLTLEWEDKWMERDMRAFLCKAKQDMRPLSLQGNAAFINFPDGALPADVCERAYWGDNRDELRRIKEIWDKDNFFKSKQGVRLPPKFIPGGASRGRKAPEKSGDQGNDEDLTDSLASSQWETYETKDIVGGLQELADLGL
ncbi:FAD-binding domain-containing protein [Coprinopsis marcescibilis]|uniref:FAD-binding domain-containing protein n=1 Tax=Coprinopsis marcescibilis TaxID=230819 RepID=A0A5C3KLP1_COPMA|nr:FAD-binding domain-containing protein [Coprinopsis marcescibilis]